MATADEKKLVCERLGARIRDMRVAQDLTQARFAGMIGVARTYLNELESGKRIPSLSTLLKITQGLGTCLSDLFDGVDSASSSGYEAGQARPS